ncbi:MAG TPA: transglycosylase domain-containing protein [Solirubrobacteraceae bacterium]|nr:transglycosylase domain-containing protein [Solirubrobacteraceae bacterium]
MSDDVHATTPGDDLGGPIPFAPPRRRRLHRRGSGRPAKPRIRKFRLALILLGFAVLAVVSTAFGMMMAVAQDLPQLENIAQYRHAANSMLYDDEGRLIGIFAPPNNVVVVQHINQISRYMQDAIISVEDKRFYSNPGIDFRGVARAVLADVTGGSALQGASTIEQQFVKVALSEQSNRTVFEKLREAALAYNLDHRWSKAKILRQYLNAVYFGNGAYGIESAARVYFGSELGFLDTAASSSSSASVSAPGTATTATTAANAPAGACGDPPLPLCASKLQPYQAALLAGMVASPSGYDPVHEPAAAAARRNQVLYDMYQQHYISRGQYNTAKARPLPTETDILQPQEPTAAPYFTSWLAPQILRAMGTNPAVAEYRAYYGGLKIRTSIDLPLQQAAESAVTNELPPGSGLPSASLVAIDNKTGEVRAMVGGPNYQTNPFNLATQGLRQPGSSFKPFTLAVALEDGISPYSTWASAPQDIPFRGPGGVAGHFIVHNFANSYSGTNTLLGATTVSDNSIYAQVGMKVGTKHIARLAHAAGIRTPISTNPSMIIGGLKTGVSALDMAHAYETFATGGVKVWNKALGDSGGGPIGIEQITCPPQTRCPQRVMTNHPTYQRVMPAPIAQEVGQILTTVVQSGTATSAAIPGMFAAGKTGTTSNYGDAWFVGWTPKLTVAVWVGYPNGLKPMTTQWNGTPVEGGTYPAAVWHNFMVTALQIIAQEAAAKVTSKTTTITTPAVTSSGNGGGAGSSTTPSTAAPTTPSTATPTTAAPTTPATTTPAAGGTPTGNSGAGGTPTTGGGSGGAAPPSGGAGLGGSP